MRAFPLMLVGMAGVAHAAPVAQLSADIDGDGVADAIELGADGALHIHGGGDVRLVDGIRSATITTGPVQGKAAVVVHAVTARGDEAFVVTHGSGTWRVAWHGEAGGVGLDAEYGVEVAGTASGVLRYQWRPGVRRCDGKPAYLFAEQFDGTEWKRRDKLPVDVPQSSPKLTAAIDSAAITSPPVRYKATWASTEPGADNASDLSRPHALDDGKLDTAWHEELAQSDGEGQFFTFTSTVNDAQPRQLRIVSGDQASATKLKDSNRLKDLAIATAQGTWVVELPDAAQAPLGTAYVVDLPPGITGCATVVIASTYGRPNGVTSIAELELFVDGERAGGGAQMLVTTVADGRDGAQSAASSLAHQGAAAIPAIENELTKTTDEGARGRLVRVLVAIKDPAAGSLLARAASSGWVEGADLIAVTAALGALHDVTELVELASKQDLAIEARVAAANALDATTKDGAVALTGLAGIEPRALRHRVIERLAAAPAAGLVAAAQASATPAGSGDLWRAAGRAAKATPAGSSERAATLAAMVTALASATDYERRYRLVDGIATLGGASDLHALAAAVGKIAGSDGVALRQVAAIAIGASPRPDAVELVLALARDVDPGVRLAALAALMQASDDGNGGPWAASPGPAVEGIDHVAIDALVNDSWPDVRIRAAQALSQRCQRPGPAAALAGVIGKDKALPVQVEALIALVACHAPGIAELLAKTWDDAKAPLDLRARAIGLAVPLGDRALATKLVGRFTAWRGGALESKDQIQLAMEAANAIGRLAPPGAAEALVDSLDDSAFPEIVGAAAAGLGSLGRACPPTAKAKLVELAQSEDQQIRLPAQHAAASCGR